MHTKEECALMLGVSDMIHDSVHDELVLIRSCDPDRISITTDVISLQPIEVESDYLMTDDVMTILKIFLARYHYERTTPARR